MSIENLTTFASGPLFRLSFTLMVLGLIRAVYLTISHTAAAYRNSADKIVPWRDVILRTLGWLVPIKRLVRKRPVYSSVSVIFHLGLILVPLFYATHILLWKNSTGVAWFALPASVADWLTVAAVVAGLALFMMRAFYAPGRAISRRQDYLWPLLLVIPFITGWLCVHGKLSAPAYAWSMLIHVYTADLVMLMIPFTKIAHCILVPLSQVVTAVGWKFPAGAGERVIETLGYKGNPTWKENSRLS